MSTRSGDGHRPAPRSYLDLVSADAPEASTARVHLMCASATGARRPLASPGQYSLVAEPYQHPQMPLPDPVA